MEPITSVETIARDASAAAALWRAQPFGHPKPANPYSEHVFPDHHREWARRFEIALLRSQHKEAA